MSSTQRWVDATDVPGGYRPPAQQQSQQPGGGAAPAGQHNPHLDFLPHSRHARPEAYRAPLDPVRPRFEVRSNEATNEAQAISKMTEFEVQHGINAKTAPAMGRSTAVRQPGRHGPRWVPPIVHDVISSAVNLEYHVPQQRGRDIAIDVSTAEVVEAPLAAKEQSPLRGSHSTGVPPIVAYDDGDPFAFPVRQIPLPAQDTGAPDLHAVVRSLTVVQTPLKILLITHDRRGAFVGRTAALHEGWSWVPIKHDGPSPGGPLLPFGDHGERVIAMSGDRVFLLSLDGMAWHYYPIQRYVPVGVTWAQTLPDDRLYFRSDSAHGAILARMEVLVRGDAPQLLMHCRMFRNKPVEDELVVVPGVSGMAMYE